MPSGWVKAPEMRLFLTYLWVGGAVLYTLNTLAYTYLEPPERPTAISPLTSDKAPPRKVTSWGSHLSVENPDMRPERRSDPIEVMPQPLAEVTGSDVATSAEVEEPHVPDANEADPKADVRGMKTGTTIPRVPHNEETATSGPPLKSESSEDSDRKQKASKAKIAKLEEPAAASSTAPEKRVTERRSLPPPVVEMTYPGEPRLSRREKRRADRAGLGVFRFGPQGF